ncbi:MAG: ABC transporter permease DevC [Phormidesmis sp.]
MSSNRQRRNRYARWSRGWSRLSVHLFTTSLSWRNLWYRQAQFMTALAAITFVVFLLFAQLGVRHALATTSAAFVEHLDADLVMVNPKRYVSNVEQPFSRQRLYQARSLTSVTAAYPLYITLGNWRQIESPQGRPIRILAFNPDQPVFLMPEVQAVQKSLKLTNTVLSDRQSRQVYGRLSAGVRADLSGQPVTVVGEFSLGATFISDGNLIMSDRTFIKLFANQPSNFEGGVRSSLNQVDIGLLKVAPEADIESVVRQLNLRLPADVVVKPKQQWLQEEAAFWLRSTAIGFIFELGAAMAFVVGIVMVYNVIYTNINNHLSQYATLRAMGHPHRYLRQIVFSQALIVAVFGFIPGVFLSLGFYRVVNLLTGLLMEMESAILYQVFGLTLSMCLVSGQIALRKLRALDPVDAMRQHI